MQGQREEGSALVFALLAVIVLGGLATMFVARAVMETRTTGIGRDFEGAIHIAEGGLDTEIQVLNDQTDHVTQDSAGAGHVYGLSSGATEAEEYAWALGIATDPNQCAIVAVGGGEACVIRPEDAVGAPIGAVYSVGMVPSQADPQRHRVVKIRFDKGFFSAEKAVLTNGSLEIGGSLHITGSGAAVHTNGDLTVSGSSVTVDGDVTSSGTYGANESQSANFGSGSGQVSYEERTQPMYAEQVYAGTDSGTPAQNAAAEWDGTTLTYDGDWYDLCPDGKVKVPAFDATSGDPAPCTGPVLYDPSASNAPSSFRGWKPPRTGNTWKAGGGANLCSGVYYVYERNAEISGRISPCSGTIPRITVLVDATGDIDPDAGVDTTCASASGMNDGNISVSGTGNNSSLSFEPYLLDLLYMVDRDLDVAGNSGTSLRGFMGAHEQVEVTGTPNVNGAVYAEDACDTPNSPVSVNKVSGNFTLTHNSDLRLPMPSLVRITAWNELSEGGS